MVYQIDEQTLRKLIKECITNRLQNDKDFEEVFQEAIRRNKRRLVEMAIRRKDYKSKVEGTAPQIIQNICLLRHCVIFGETNNKVHWGNELKTHMLNVMDWEIKGSNDYGTKETVIREVWNIYFDPKSVESTIYTTFRKEGFDVKGKEFLEIISDCINSFNILTRILSSGNREDVREFVRMVSN
ncbi:MAG: hypothetical protein J6X18_05150 [Bacteroidales bacterium]|nr:hypothetical protein [Bacteroidales bacterium]